MPKTTFPRPKLSDSQLVILGAAAQRSDGSLLPFPRSLTVKGAALAKAVETLRKRKLAKERPAINGTPEWRRDDDDRPLGLFITNAGLLALEVDGADKVKPAQAAASVPRRRKTGTSKPRHKAQQASPVRSRPHAASSKSKQDLVIQMLRRRSGVTVDDITAKTGWQPHSVRGFFSGLVKKKLKLPLTSDVGKDGVRHYHIAPTASAKG